MGSGRAKTDQAFLVPQWQMHFWMDVPPGHATFFLFPRNHGHGHLSRRDGGYFRYIGEGELEGGMGDWGSTTVEGLRSGVRRGLGYGVRANFRSREKEFFFLKKK